MNAAIFQFRAFETSSLHHADETVPDETGHKVGGWDQAIPAEELHVDYVEPLS